MSTKGAGSWKLGLIALGAFGFSFALVPLYEVACEKVFGIRLERDAAQAPGAATEANDRVVTVIFDGGVNSKLPWSFEPNQLQMQVRPGELYETTYFARNKSEQATVGSAVPSVAPARASGYFSKTECFCFTAQALQPGESRDMPVRFIVDPDLPEGIQTLTLSYTFFRNDTLTAELRAAGTQVPHAAP